MKAIEVLLSHGVKEEKILFLNLVSRAGRSGSDHQIASPEGIKNVCTKFPKLRIVSLASRLILTMIDHCMGR